MPRIRSRWPADVGARAVSRPIRRADSIDDRRISAAPYGAPMNTVRVGRVFRALRRRRGWRQVDLALRARVSASTISRIEAGDFMAMPLEVIERVASALGVTLELVARWQGEALDRLLDEAHASLVDALVREYKRHDWEVAVEVSFAIGGERGSIDVLAFNLATRLLAVNEVKSVVPDVQAMIHGLDRKARLGPRVAAERGWHADRVLRMLVVADDRTSRRRIERHAAVFDAAFPVRGHAARAWLRDPTARIAAEGGHAPVSALLFLPSVHRVDAGSGPSGRHRIRRSAAGRS